MGRDLLSDDVVLIAAWWPEPTEFVERLRKAHSGIRVVYHQLGGTLKEIYGLKVGIPKDLLKETTVLCTMAYTPTPEEAPKLDLVHVFSAGINHLVDTPLWKDTDVTITTSSGVHGPQISEWIMMYLLMHTHHVRQLEEWQRNSEWGKTYPQTKDLVTQRIGILSYGSIGRQTARIARALGMEVYAYTASPRPTPESKRDHGYIVPGTGDLEGEYPSKWFSGTDNESLHAFLGSDLDVLVLTVPLTADTTHLIGKEEFEILKKSGKNTFLINVSRGQVIVQDELIKAVETPPEEGGLRGAALDVTDPEPLPSDSNLWSVKNVYISPHCSGYGIDYLSRSLAIFEINLNHRAKGEKLINVADRKKGY